MAIKANYFFDPLLGRPKLRSNLPDKVDTVVIGGGIAGLTILYFLLMNKKNAIMLDETEVGFRSSGRSLGCVGFPNVHNTRSHDFNAINEAIRCNNNVLIELIKKESIGCDFSYAGEVQISDQSMDAYDKYLNVMQIDNNELHKIFPLSLVRKLNGIFIPNACSFNVYTFLNILASACEMYGSRLYGNVSATNIERKKDGSLIVHNSFEQKLECNNVVLCAPSIAATIRPDYNDVFIVDKMHGGCTKIMPDRWKDDFLVSFLNFVDVDIRVRFNRNRLFMDWGGYLSKDQAIEIIDQYIPKTFKRYELDYTWNDNIYSTTDNLPIIGKIDDNIYINTAHGRHGLSLAIFGSVVIFEELSQKKDLIELVDKIFLPDRF